jgi:two-component system, chemotaxis family, protein-glutamate methylesterase/glutaminase
MGREIKVMVVDDSAVVRKVMSAILDRDPDIRVIGTAHDPIFAIDKMRKDWPDVVTLDVEMPRMDGITFLRQLMAERPTPVVICSSLTTLGAETTLQALTAGAVSIISKPGLGVEAFLNESSDDLVAANMGAVQRSAQLRSQGPDRVAPPLAMAQTTDRIVVIGTSTGGTVALHRLVRLFVQVCLEREVNVWGPSRNLRKIWSSGLHPN